MGALQAPGATVIENIYTEKSEKYLNSKNFDVTTIVKDRATRELKVKSQIPYNQLVNFLAKLTTHIVRDSTSVFSEDKKSMCPKTPGQITDIITHSAADFRLKETSSRNTILCVLGGTRAAAVDP